MNNSERLILVTNYQILSFVDKENSEDHQRLIEFLLDGHTELFYENIPSLSPVMSRAEQQEIANIVDMYYIIQVCFLTLKTPVKLTLKDVEFLGFDGNQEGQKRRLTSALFKEKYSDHSFQTPHGVSKTCPNSHIPMNPKYMVMLAKYNSIKKQTAGKMLTEKDLLDIIR